PVFSWFFGRDGLWTGLAANMCGMGEYTRAHMETLLRHSENGRIPHEIGLGTGNGQQYNVSDSMVDTKFMSIDSNLLWLLCNFSLRYYGYDSFPSAVVERVYEFSKGCDENNDLLLENSFSKGLIGWPETWAKYRDGACVDINALWIEVLRNYGISKEYYESSRKKYLDTFFNGTIFVDSVNNGAKKVVKSSTLLVPAMFLDEESVRKTLLRLNDNAILTAWGVRSVASDDPMFDGGYHTGMVWPLMTGWFVFASYRQKMKESGFNQLLTFVNLAFASEDPGRINEVYDSSQPNPVGQFAQSWSSGMFIFSLLGGMLGMRISGDPPQNVKEVFDAALPEDWDKVYFKNFKWAGLTYDIEITSNGVHVI
ncbi:MAG TPA: amylo-alpha-1,6-glucosidase, partial [Thermoplasmataceae archaeon]|nr:amylo-alpha-1,6-glucosidase [Thermoplasmataceae archaeon]